jgi:hypothetical protein
MEIRWRKYPWGPAEVLLGTTAKVKGDDGEKTTKACSLREFLSHISGGKQYLETDLLMGEAQDYEYREERLVGAEVGENTLYLDVDYAAKQMSTRFESTPSWCRIKDGANKYKDNANRLGRQLRTSRKR